MIEAGKPITTYRTEIRAGLVSLAVPVIVIGGWALIAPRSWYDNFPIDSADWISSLGAYQEHLVRDFGSLYLALGLLLVFAGVVLDRLLVQAVLGASLVFQVPHLIFHAANTEPFSSGQQRDQPGAAGSRAAGHLGAARNVDARGTPNQLLNTQDRRRRNRLWHALRTGAG